MQRSSTFNTSGQVRFGGAVAVGLILALIAIGLAAVNTSVRRSEPVQLPLRASIPAQSRIFADEAQYVLPVSAYAGQAESYLPAGYGAEVRTVEAAVSPAEARPFNRVFADEAATRLSPAGYAGQRESYLPAAPAEPSVRRAVREALLSTAAPLNRILGIEMAYAIETVMGVPSPAPVEPALMPFGPR
jgi:hypothetical protein